MYEAYRAAGGNFVDTADKYTGGASEQIVGQLIASEDDQIVLATKYSLTADPDDPNGGGTHRKRLVHALDASLKRLGTDYIDLYSQHAWDYLTPTEEVMRALDDQLRTGKILYVGVSDTPAWIISRANAIAELRTWTPFVSLQIQYSLVERTVERDLIPMARSLDLAVTAWGPLGSGLLSGKYTRAATPQPTDASTLRAESRALASKSSQSPRRFTMLQMNYKPLLLLSRSPGYSTSRT